jgi:hypothetical protein
MDFRKLMLIYRLIHFTDSIPDIDIGVDGRDKELCKPVIQLFYNSKSQEEIEQALQKFLDAKSQRKENTIEAALYPIIANLISRYGNEIPASSMWELIIGNVEGYFDERKPNEYQTSEHGTIYRNSITNIICDKFGTKRGNVLIFNPEKVVRAGKLYDRKVNIQTKLIQSDPESPEDPESSLKELDGSKDDTNTENIVITDKIDKNPQEFTQAIGNTLQSETQSSSLKPSEPSAITSQENTTYRLGLTDTFACKKCTLKGDKWFMRQHNCRGQIKG